MIERRRQTGIAVAASHDFRVWPDLEADLPQRVADLPLLRNRRGKLPRDRFASAVRQELLADAQAR